MTPIHHDCLDAFSAAECDAMIAIAAADAGEAGPVWGGAGYALDPAVRSVRTVFRARSEETGWIYDRLDRLFGEAAERLGVAVAPVSEDIQIMAYGVGNHFQVWHSDAGTDLQARRILSVSVELSEPGDHDGGDLEIVPVAIGRRTLPRGAARLFLSRALHRVTPVTRGTRHSLVSWTGAPG
ncbi:MAG TPA: 2OG-Fe(II) oxygenase [Allosphingosinicella sp.]